MILDAAIGKYKGKATSEHALLRQLLHGFEAADIVFHQHALRVQELKSEKKLITTLLSNKKISNFYKQH